MSVSDLFRRCSSSLSSKNNNKHNRSSRHLVVHREHATTSPADNVLLRVDSTRWVSLCTCHIVDRSACFGSLVLVSPLLIFCSSSDQWHSKSKCTQKEFANHMDITCHANEFILIGWSHYGTKKTDRTRSTFKQQQQQQR
jgi:hypothetical protein